MPKRIRLSRARGWRKPPNCVVVSRPSRRGNPWPVARVRRALVDAMDWSQVGGNELWNAMYRWNPRRRGPDLAIARDIDRIAQAASAALFHALAEQFRRSDPEGFERWVAPLRGCDLGCWCGLDDPCHADILIELANGVAPAPIPRDRHGKVPHG
jgi:hypothetical protein